MFESYKVLDVLYGPDEFLLFLQVFWSGVARKIDFSLISVIIAWHRDGTNLLMLYLVTNKPLGWPLWQDMLSLISLEICPFSSLSL